MIELELIAAVQLGNGTNKFTNSGTFTFVGYGGGDDSDIVKNSGTIGDVSLGNGTNTFINSGKATSFVGGGTGDDTITNSGRIDGVVGLGNGTNKLINSGTISGTVTTGTGDDTVSNSGTIAGLITLGAGDDNFTGGAKAEQAKDGDGTDSYKFGGGNDTYIATGSAGTDGNDTVDGGTGTDLFDASASLDAVYINLDTADHDLTPALLPASAFVAKNTAIGLAIASAGTDKVTGFESAKGGGGDDILYGSAAANALDGGPGSDFLLGFAGNDILTGGGDADTLVGGTGKDTLSLGGADASVDKVIYLSTADSGVTKATRDVIIGFEDGLDQIDLSSIDANTKNPVPSNDPFVYINIDSSVTPGAIFAANTPGQLRSYRSADGIIVEGDVNGDGKADFAIEIYDPTHAITLTAADFVL